MVYVVYTLSVVQHTPYATSVLLEWLCSNDFRKPLYRFHA